MAYTARKNVLQSGAEILDRLPPLPENWKRIFTKIYPWLLIIEGVWTGFGVFPVLFRSLPGTATYMFQSPYALGSVGGGLLWLILAGGIAVISLLAGFQMLKMRRAGWRLAMIEAGLSILTALAGGSGFGLVLSFIALYSLWQVQSYYF